MTRNSLYALVGLAVCAAPTLAEDVTIAGTKYPTTVVTQVDGRPVQQVLTGVALRKKLLFHVYTIASYLEAGVKARSAEEMVSVDKVKQFHLVMQRDVSGQDMAEAFTEAVRLNHAAPAFEAELKFLTDKLSDSELARGSQIRLTYLPGAGLEADLNGQLILIQNPAFARAVWEIYFGRRNIDGGIKSGLVSRLQ